MKQLKTLVAVLLLLAGAVSSVMAQTGSAAQYMQAGNTAYGAKNYDQAIQYYQAVVNLTPNYGPAYQGLGNCYYFKGDNTSALSNYEKALNLDPNNASLSSFVQSLRAKVGTTAPVAATVSPAASASAASMGSSSAANKFELDLNAGVAFASGTTGFGGGLGGYMPLDKSFYIGALLNFYTFSEGASASAGGASASASASINFLEAMAGIKYKFEGTSMRPYIFGGVGINDVMTSASETVSGGGSSASASASASAIDPMVAVGGGVEFPAGRDMNIFVQGKYSIVFVPGVTETVNTGYGTTTVSGGGGTSTYLPIEVGINFSL